MDPATPVPPLAAEPVQAPPLTPQPAAAPPLASQPAPEPPDGDQDNRSTFRRKLGAAGAAAVALLAKLKGVLLLLGKVKLLATAGTMAVSVVAYASIWGFSFALGFVVLLLVHELGHVIALRREGIRASAPMFVPFLGAVITSRSLGDNALAEARVGLAGPVLGSVGAAACVGIYHATGQDLWRALAYTGFLLNLFNLLPVVPLDGGRAMAAMAPWMWGVGFAGLIALIFVMPNPILLIILVFGGISSWRRWQQVRHGEASEQAYYRVAPLDRALVAAVYLSLVALLVVGMHATDLPRTIA